MQDKRIRVIIVTFIMLIFVFIIGCIMYVSVANKEETDKNILTPSISGVMEPSARIQDESVTSEFEVSTQESEFVTEDTSEEVVSEENLDNDSIDDSSLGGEINE